MRFLKAKTINWKYIFGEIFLLFIGINLAIWFNDWNASKAMDKNREIALEKIEGEIEANLEEMLQNSALNQQIPSFFNDLENLKNQQGDLVTTPEEMQAFIKKYPNQIVSVDSTEVGSGNFDYDLGTLINLEITDLSSIAWEISKSTGIFHEFGYDCLYDLQAMYNTQDLVKAEINKATEALKNRAMQDLIRTLGIVEQLESQLEKQYRDMLENIPNCR